MCPTRLFYRIIAVVKPCCRTLEYVHTIVVTNIIRLFEPVHIYRILFGRRRATLDDCTLRLAVVKPCCRTLEYVHTIVVTNIIRLFEPVPIYRILFGRRRATLDDCTLRLALARRLHGGQQARFLHFQGLELVRHFLNVFRGKVDLSI
jgi:hypothetical protein